MIATKAVISTTLGADLAEATEAVQRSTVQVRGRGPGGGSGVIWSADGLIITNAHVAHWQHGDVELWDGRVFPAEVIARDDERDLAALRIKATDLPAAPIGDSDALRVGELVMAVGNPLGIIGALTVGMVHAAPTGQALRGRNWVQADVHLAPGNSGGPLTDARGRVIGINSMIAGGLALAVPSNAVQAFLSRPAASERPMLGVALQPVDLGAGRRGMLIFAVVPESAAEAAGLIIGDILTGVDGRPFAGPEDFAAALNAARDGAPLPLDVLRGGKPQRVTVTITQASAPATVAA